MDLTPLVGVAFAVVFGLIFYFTHKYQQKKLAEYLKKKGSMYGFQYINRQKNELKTELEGFNIRNKWARTEKITLLLEGRKRDAKWKIMKYRYVQGSGKNSQTRTYTVYQIKKEQINMPSFFIGTETIFHKIASTFGYQDIDFSQFPGFSKNYIMRGEKEEDVKKFVRRHLPYFENKKIPYTIEGRNDTLLIYNQKNPSPGFLEKDFNKVREIADMFLRS